MRYSSLFRADILPVYVLKIYALKTGTIMEWNDKKGDQNCLLFNIEKMFDLLKKFIKRNNQYLTSRFFNNVV